MTHRHYGIPRQQETDDDALGFFIGVKHALMAEGIAVVILCLGFVVWVNVYNIWAKW